MPLMNFADVYGTEAEKIAGVKQETLVAAASGNTQAGDEKVKKSPAKMWVIMVAALVGIRLLYEFAVES